MKYYEPIRAGVTIDNIHMVPLLLQMRWFGQKPSSDIHLAVRFPVNDNHETFHLGTARFHNVMWDNLDDSNTSPFRKARLRVQGEYGQKEIYANIELNLDEPNDKNLCIILSPIPFGIDGKLKLPFRNNSLRTFLWVAKVLTLFQDRCITINDFERQMLAVFGRSFSRTISISWLAETDRLGITCDRGLGNHDIVMLPQVFEATFGIKLP